MQNSYLAEALRPWARSMAKRLTIFTAALTVAAFTATGCASTATVSTVSDAPATDGATGSDTSTGDARSGSETETTTNTNTDATSGSDGTSNSDDRSDSAEPTEVPAGVPSGDKIIGSASMNGEIVSGQQHPIDDYMILESYPEQIVINFTAGDINCTAAHATATATADQVILNLTVGITTDAMARSCVAGEVGHQLTIALSEGLNGRELVIDDIPPADSSAPAEPPAKDFASTLIGMSAASAEEGAAQFGYSWRVMALDGEQFVGTTDYNEQRVNVAIENDVVVDAWLG